MFRTWILDRIPIHFGFCNLKGLPKKRKRERENNVLKSWMFWSILHSLIWNFSFYLSFIFFIYFCHVLFRFIFNFCVRFLSQIWRAVGGITFLDNLLWILTINSHNFLYFCFSLFQNKKMRLKSVLTVLFFNISLSISEDYYDLLGGYRYRIHPLHFKNIIFLLIF